MISHRSLLLRFLSRQGGAAARTTNRVLLITIYPAFLLILTSWATAVVFRFYNLSFFLLEVLTKTLVGFALAFVVYLLTIRRLEQYLRERAGSTVVEPNVAEPETSSASEVDRYRIWTQSAIAILAVYAIFSYWNRTIGELGRSTMAPEAVQIVAAYVGKCYGAVKDFYLGPFDQEAARYTGLPWRLTLGILVILFAWIVSRVTRRVVNRLVFSLTSWEQGSRETIHTLIAYVILVGGILIGLSKAGLDPASLKVVSGAFIFGITFGLQDIFRNFISGIILHFARPVRVGDFVEVAGRRGTVDKIGARSTRILGEDNVAVEVPNGSIAGGNLINWTRPTPFSMFRVPIQVTRDAPVSTVRQVMLDVAGRHPLVSPQPPPDVSFQSLTGGLMAFELLVWSRAPRESRRLISDLLFQVEAELRESKIK